MLKRIHPQSATSTVQLKHYKVVLKILPVPTTHFLAESGIAYYAFNRKLQTTFLLNQEKHMVQAVVGRMNTVQLNDTESAFGLFPPIWLWPTPTAPDPEPPEEPEPAPEEECDPDTAPDGCECPPEFLGLDCSGEGEDVATDVWSF
jgi:hypothetical protein